MHYILSFFYFVIFWILKLNRFFSETGRNVEKLFLLAVFFFRKFHKHFTFSYQVSIQCSGH
jgi:hypothetical protein